MVLQFAGEAEAQVMETIAIASLAPNANGRRLVKKRTDPAAKQPRENRGRERTRRSHACQEEYETIETESTKAAARKRKMMTDEAVKLLMLDQAPSLKTVPWDT